MVGGDVFISEVEMSLSHPRGWGGGDCPTLRGAGFPWGLACLAHVSLLSFEASRVLAGSGFPPSSRLRFEATGQMEDISAVAGWPGFPGAAGWRCERGTLSSSPRFAHKSP